MPKINHIEIDSLSLEDTNALFDAMCRKIANLTPYQGRVQILELSGTEKSINNHKATVADVLRFFAMYDPKVVLRVEYLATGERVKTGRGGEDFNPNKGLKVDPVYDALKDQANEITNPELTDLVKPPAVIDDKKKESAAPGLDTIPIASSEDLPF